MDDTRRTQLQEMEYRMRQARTILTLLMIGAAAVTAAAQERSLTRKGNELYSQKKFAEATAAYQEALRKQPQFTPGSFNLGNALIQQKKYDAARKVMENTIKTTSDPVVKGGAQYNAGNTFMSEQQWQQAVSSYKQALRNNPQDADAKYNLSYALAKLKQQQQQGGGKDDKKDQNKDGDKKDQKEKEDQGKKDQQKQQQDKDGNQQKQQQPRQPQQSKISEQQADNILKALQQDERKTQDKMQQSKAVPVKLEKDW